MLVELARLICKYTRRGVSTHGAYTAGRMGLWRRCLCSCGLCRPGNRVEREREWPGAHTKAGRSLSNTRRERTIFLVYPMDRVYLKLTLDEPSAAREQLRASHVWWANGGGCEGVWSDSRGESELTRLLCSYFSPPFRPLLFRGYEDENENEKLLRKKICDDPEKKDISLLIK